MVAARRCPIADAPIEVANTAKNAPNSNIQFTLHFSVAHMAMSLICDTPLKTPHFSIANTAKHFFDAHSAAFSA